VAVAGVCSGFLLVVVVLVALFDVIEGERATLECRQDRCTLRRAAVFGPWHSVGSFPLDGLHGLDRGCRSVASLGESGLETHRECRPSLLVTEWVPARSDTAESTSLERRDTLDIVGGKLIRLSDVTVVPITSRYHGGMPSPDVFSRRVDTPQTYSLETGVLPWPLSASVALVAIASIALAVALVIGGWRIHRSVRAAEHLVARPS
jgi:hypothetical protein